MGTTTPQSPILDALYHGRRDEARRLGEDRSTLTLFEAAALGRDDVLEPLLGGGADPNAFADDGHTPLGLAAFFAGVSTVQLLLTHGADPHAAARNTMKVQPLHAAVGARRLDSVTALLDRGADVDARQQQGYTPLMGAASAGRADLVDVLLQHGADPALTSDAGQTAADIAREHGHAELAGRLVEAVSGSARG